MDGLELTQKVKNIRPKMNIIVITGYVDDFPFDKVIEAGASDFIKKPFTLKELIARIKNLEMKDKLFVAGKAVQKKMKELEDFYNIAVRRELSMKELKEQIEELKKETVNLKQELEKYRRSN